ARERHHAALGRRVQGVAGQPDGAQYGGEFDDLAGATRDEVGRGGAAAVEDAGEVHVQDRAPVVGRGLGERRDGGDPRGGHDDGNLSLEVRQRYSSSIVFVYFVDTTFRFTFSVGVSSPPSWLKSRGSTVNFLILAYDCSCEFFSSTVRPMRSRTLGCLTTTAGSVVRMPWSRANFDSSSGLTVISATGYGLRSPYTMTWLMNGSAFRRFSMFCGAMFMPPAVTMRSFFLSVMKRKPSSSSRPLSPVWNQPEGSKTSAVASGCLRWPLAQ